MDLHTVRHGLRATGMQPIRSVVAHGRREDVAGNQARKRRSLAYGTPTDPAFVNLFSWNGKAVAILETVSCSRGLPPVIRWLHQKRLSKQRIRSKARNDAGTHGRQQSSDAAEAAAST